MKNGIWKKSGLLLLSVVLLLGLAVQVQAVDSGITPKTKADRVTKKVAYAEMRGFSQKTEDGNFQGIIIDYLNEIAKYTGWRYEYVELKPEEFSDALRSGRVDLIGGAYYQPELAEIQAYPDYDSGRSRLSLLARWEDESILNNEIASLEGKTIGILETDVQSREYLEKFLEMYHVSVRLRSFRTKELVDGSLGFYLEKGEVDAIAGITSEDFEKFRIVKHIETQPHFIVCRKDDTETLERINTALRQINFSNPNFAETVDIKNFPKIQVMKFYLTAEEQAYIARKRTVRVLLPAQMYPMAITEDATTAQGITPDIINRVSRLTGLHFEYIPFDSTDTSPAKVAQLFHENNADMVGCAVVNAEAFRGVGLSTSNTYISMPRSYIRNKHYTFQNEGMTLAMIKRQRIPGNLKPVEVLYFKSLKEVLDAVNQGKADLAFSSVANLQQMQQQYFYPNLASVTMELEDVHYCFATDAGSEDQLLTILNKAVNSMSSEELQKIRESHLALPSRSSLALIRELLYNNALRVASLGVAIVLMILLAAYKYMDERMKREKAAMELADAQSANKAKSVFLSHMSHDIRTPINGIIGMTHIALQNLGQPEVLKDALEKISHASGQLDTLMNEVLEMSRIESGKLMLEEEAFDLQALQRDLDSVISSMAEQANIHYSFRMQVQHVHLIGSSVYVERVMMNILTNAVKYTRAGGSVSANLREVALNEDQGLYELRVADTGIGMSREFLAHIFEPFARERWDAGTTYTGTGLGMSITNELVKLMQGSIQIESTQNQGTTVTIQLPLKYDFSNAEKEELGKNALHGLRVLVVEDNSLNSEIASYVLQENDAQVELAENGKIALDMYTSNAAGYYDIILMDLMMPVMDGYAASRAIRESGKADAKSIPILATTANAFAEDAQKCLQYGMNDHIAKPLNLEELVSKIRQYCNGE